jgi:hypothetical protein
MSDGKNSAIQVQDALIRAANGYESGVELSRVLRDAEAEIGIQVSETWAVEALESRGFTVDDQPDRRVVRKPGICIDPNP